MTFEEILDQALAMLQRRGRVTYRTLQRQFDLDEAALADLKDAIRFTYPQVIDEAGQGLVWPASPADQPASVAPPPAASMPPEAERRQLTVLFCDLADSTRLASQLDPEDLREVIRAYQQTSAGVIQRFDGSIAQYLGDGVLVYFGYPQAHEDDAQRAVRAGLGILEAMGPLRTRLERDKRVRLTVRIGIHTGPVVVGEVGGGGRHEQLALGETPNLAARIQSLAAPNTVAISDATLRLVEGYFTSEDLGLHTLKGVETPLRVSRIVGESEVQSRLEVAATRGLTPLVGREREVEVLLDRWAQAREGLGQVVVLSGEAGIGKSRLLQVLKDQLADDVHTRLECRSSPYYQHTVLYPVTELCERIWAFTRDDAPPTKLAKMERVLGQYRLSLPEAVPLLAALFSLPLPDDLYASLTLSSQRQRQKTLATLLAMVVALAEQQPLLFIVEDLHWVDPSTLEWLTLLIDQTPTSRLCLLLTSRPAFHPPWGSRSYLTQLTLTRLTQPQVEQMVERLTGGKALPAEVVRHLVEKTDGVPLYVEEMTKAILESGLLRNVNGQYELVGSFSSVAIPTTLQDSLMARLDHLGPAKGVAQVGATIGRQFAYELLQAVSPLEEEVMQRELGRLVEAELVYQRGVPPQATYMFKHTLIQDAAYQSLLRSTRQQYHQRIAQVLEGQFPQVIEMQPELLAHHYTEAGLREQAIPYWQQAGQQALQRSANLEAVQHLTTGLALLATLPETLGRVKQELDLQLALGPALLATKGNTAPEVEQTYVRARALCAQIGDTPQLFLPLRGLCRLYTNRGALPTARELGEQLVRFAEQTADPTRRLEAHETFGNLLFYLGDYAAAQRHFEQGIVLTDPAAQRALALRSGMAPGVGCLGMAAHTLWCLGYPAQAVRRSQEALAQAQVLAHAHSLAVAQHFAAWLHQRRRDVPAVQGQADVLLHWATAQGFPLWVGSGIFWQGWILAVSGQGEAGLTQMRQGIAAVWATRAELWRPFGLVLLAEAAGHVGQVVEGLRLLAEAREALEANAQGDMLVEAHRLQGEFLLQQATPDVAQAEACFQQALTIARHQQAKSWELRAAISLARLWQRQGKRAEAHALLAPIYGWFTEGFDTADLQEARALLEMLGA